MNAPTHGRKYVQSHQALTLQNVYSWPGQLGSVAASMFTTADVTTNEEFSRRWHNFTRRVLTPTSGGRWICFREPRQRGDVHCHVLHWWPEVAEGSEWRWKEGDASEKPVGEWVEKGDNLRSCIEAMNECRKYGFGWNTSEPLRGTTALEVRACVGYFSKYLTKSRYKPVGGVLEGGRLVNYGQGCLKRYGCHFRPEFPPCSPKRWQESKIPRYSVNLGLLENSKREMVAWFCGDVGIEVDQVSVYAEARNPELPAFVALRRLWSDVIVPGYKAAKVAGWSLGGADSSVSGVTVIDPAYVGLVDDVLEGPF